MNAFHRIMNVVGPKLDYIADRWLLLAAAVLFLLIPALLLGAAGILIIVGAIVVFAAYVYWDLHRESAELMKEELIHEHISREDAREHLQEVRNEGHAPIRGDLLLRSEGDGEAVRQTNP